MTAASRRRRILIVDDERVQRKAMKLALRAKGHVCVGVDTPAQALAAVVAEDIDVVLLEWLLPSGGAEGLAGQLRERCATAGRSVRIAVVSTKDEPDGIRQAEGLDGYFTKPVDIAELARWVAGDAT